MKKNRFEPRPKESTTWLLVIAMIALLIAFTWVNPSLNFSTSYYASKQYFT